MSSNFPSFFSYVLFLHLHNASDACTKKSMPFKSFLTNTTAAAAAASKKEFKWKDRQEWHGYTSTYTWALYSPSVFKMQRIWRERGVGYNGQNTSDALMHIIFDGNGDVDGVAAAMFSQRWRVWVCDEHYAFIIKQRTTSETIKMCIMNRCQSTDTLELHIENRVQNQWNQIVISQMEFFQ